MKSAVGYGILLLHLNLLAFVSAGEVEYRYYRFTPTQLRVTNNCCVQLAEFEFLREGVRVGTPLVSNPGGRNPSNETPDLSVDGSLSTKWLDFNQGSLLFDFGGPKKVDSYRWATANDATERDPVQWLLEGSDDETSWVLVDERVGVDFPTPVSRFTFTPTLDLNVAPAVGSFTVDRPLIPPGLPVTLSWEVDQGTTGLTINHGVGSVLGLTTDGVGSITLAPGPLETRVYEITATHENGQSTAEVAVTVTSFPVIHEFSSPSTVVGPGDRVTLNWEVFHADRLTLDGEEVTGTFAEKVLSTSRTFILSAINGTGTTTAEVSVQVVEPGVPVISEFMASNDGALVVDEDGDDSDWIEIYNPSGSIALLNGYFLTDDPGDLRKWAFPAVTLDRGEYLLVWASGKNRTVAGSELHTNFKLNADGEYLALVKPDGVTIVTEYGLEGVSYPAQNTGVSFGGFGEFQQQGYFSSATPEKANSEGFLGYVKDTRFSVKRGHFSAPFSLEITSNTAGASIRYTTDGSTPSESNGTLYTGPITIARTMPVRAIAYLEGMRSTNVDTQTYFFLDDVITQSAATTQSVWGMPADWSGTSPDYGLNASVTALHAATIKDDLQTVPSLSIVMPNEDLFGSSGIYSHPENSGINWERATSLELIDPAHPDGTMNFQIDCGMRIQGGAFRRFDLTKKKSFRLLFKGIYGDSKLRYPLFGDLTTDEFDTLIFRMESNDGYQWGNRTNVQYARDQFGRRSASELGIPASRGRYFHVYLNGVYWGIYNVVERPDVSFGVTHFGAEKEDWDAINFGTPINESRGDYWNTLVSLAAQVSSAGSESARTAAYMKVQGLNPDGSNHPAWADFLNVENLCDYLLVNWYTGNADWPHRNYYTGRERDLLDPIGWRGSRTSTGTHFFMWDVETSMLLNSSIDQTGATSGVNVPYGSLRASKEFQMKMGDRAHRALFNGGALTATASMARYADLTKNHRSILIPELARWGDQHGSQRTIAQWESAYQQIQSQWLADRSPELVEILRKAKLYPDLPAPRYSQHGGEVALGGGPSLSVPLSVRQIYYSYGPKDSDLTDYHHPLDPRLPGGGISPTARLLTLGGGVGGETTQFLSSGDLWRYLDDGTDQGTQWRGDGFNDSLWSEGPSPLGYGDGDEAQVVGFIDADPVAGGVQKNATTYFRKRLSIFNPTIYGEFQLDYLFDDAIAIYVNGVEVERVNLDAEAPFDRYANQQSAENQSGTIILDPSFFVAGENLIAVEIHQLNGNSSDISFDLELRGQPAGGDNRHTTDPLVLDESGWLYSRSYDPGTGEWSALNTAYFKVETEAASAENLVVSEIHYHPGEPLVANEMGVSTNRDDYEFIEVMNIGNRTIDLSGVELTSGIAFAFAENRLLGVGERLILVSNAEAFAARYPGVEIGGVFASGRLANNGERIVLESAVTGIIRDFTYDDLAPWPGAGDGEGFSLVLVAPRRNPNHQDPASWRSSADRHGSPGGTDGVNYAAWKLANGITDDLGDPDGDGRSNLAEFAQGSDFQKKDSWVELTGRMVAGFFEVEIQRNLRAVDQVELLVETSADLQSWFKEAIHTGETNLGDGIGLVRYRIPLDGKARSFARARWLLRNP